MISASRQTPVQDAFRIGESHHVEPSLNSVIGPGGAIRLEPKVMQVLVCLATHTGQVVSKERLMHTVWPDTFVGDDVLTRAISELRHAFGDDAKHPRFIQTIAKRGYRLIPDCVGLTGTDSESRVDLLRPAPWKLTLRARWLWMAVAMALITGALVWRWSRAHVQSEPRTLAAMRTVPLTTLTGEEDWPSFSPDGDQVAFEWRGEKGDNADIYVAMVGSSEVRRLTTDPEKGVRSIS